MRHAVKGGDSYWEITGVSVKAGEGSVVGAIAVARNVTEHVRAEEKLEATNRLALIGQLASGIAHEINNPITGVMAFSDLLMREHVSDDVKEAVQIIHEGAQRVSDIVRRLLRFARPQSRCQKCTDINAAIQATLDLQRYSLVADNIAVSTELDPELPRTMADEAQIQEVFHNLIANARAEMKIAYNGGNLFIRTQVVGDSIRISFNDDGPGISRDHMKKLFTPFFTTRPIGEGTGLGLSICHNIISEHNGRMYAESQLGKGASFVVEIPIVGCESQPSIIQDVQSESAKSARLRVLIVYD
jgi:two-component system NtrC family sensor kinase